MSRELSELREMGREVFFQKSYELAARVREIILSSEENIMKEAERYRDRGVEPNPVISVQRTIDLLRRFPPDDRMKSYAIVKPDEVPDMWYLYIDYWSDKAKDGAVMITSLNEPGLEMVDGQRDSRVAILIESWCYDVIRSSLPLEEQRFLDLGSYKRRLDKRMPAARYLKDQGIDMETLDIFG